ncbi:short-chain dehydrogenase/reductase SDR [Halodesulfurarchaeum formicicum]|uniref:Short-chain dehydrogenase/reductase SDR n=1 Tax=Halodesulfurarchaeum formicicum TaxID=1873524 RepID=A0A1D8S233_9EURY|nr:MULTISPECIES: SDR family oxidoreductase [Halodesulfurarchaeum]AOW79416.1 short-chain dehydrogenase/reductase SDR [Halodesulfurarchaeum formicicum]APE94669.1 short-chain dehydrogenase/reductase SDR [Halodesulfurarchaeum formicicum]MDR5655963.1 SDR family oxidoreductase [Halodesulfurarchaeum sp. HSR-GB]
MSEFTAVLTGASRGIGAAVAEAFAGAGGQLILGAREKSAVEDVADGLDAEAVAVDVRDEDSVSNLLAVAADRLGEIDVLVPSAGVYHGPSGATPLPAESYERYDDHMATNARGVFATIREAVPHLAADARVLVPSGKPARVATPGTGSYAVSKAAAEAIARGFAADLDQVVGIVDPGQVQTELTGKDFGRLPADVAPMYVWAAREAPAETIDGQVVGIKAWLRATRGEKE